MPPKRASVPALRGTDAQLTWAGEIRDRLLAALQDADPDDPQAAKARGLVRRYHDAGWWIEHRQDVYALCGAWEAATIREALPQGGEDARLSPSLASSCEVCQRAVPVGASTCPACVDRAEHVRRCPACGYGVSVVATRSCPNCYADLPAAEPVAQGG